VTRSSLNQSFYTQIFAAAAGLKLSNQSLDGYSWWWNPTNIQNLRLNKKGYDFVIKIAKIQTYEIILQQPLLSHHFIKLSRLNLGPYYLKGHNKIILLDDKVATMLMLHAGDLGQYLENLQL